MKPSNAQELELIVAGFTAACNEAVADGVPADRMLVSFSSAITRFGVDVLGPAHLAACYSEFIDAAESVAQPGAQDEVPVLLSASDMPEVERFAEAAGHSLRRCVMRGLAADQVLSAATGTLLTLSAKYLGSYNQALRWTKAQLKAIESGGRGYH